MRQRENLAVDYTKYFPLRTTKEVAGAYDFLIDEGYKEQVDCIKSEGYNTNTRRLMVVGLIYEKNLISKFLNVVWTQGGFDYRKDRMDIWYRRHRKRPELHTCWR